VGERAPPLRLAIAALGVVPNGRHRPSRCPIPNRTKEMNMLIGGALVVLLIVLVWRLADIPDEA
jgi:hypothetical protein